MGKIGRAGFGGAVQRFRPREIDEIFAKLRVMKMQTSSILIALVFFCFALPPKGQAVNPAPDGGYPGGNTAEGQNALFSLSSGTYTFVPIQITLLAVVTAESAEAPMAVLALPVKLLPLSASAPTAVLKLPSAMMP
jgi:hypothetical protein